MERPGQFLGTSRWIKYRMYVCYVCQESDEQGPKCVSQQVKHQLREQEGTLANPRASHPLLTERLFPRGPCHPSVRTSCLAASWAN